MEVQILFCLKVAPNLHGGEEWSFEEKWSCIYGELGWYSGESTRLPRMWPGFDSWSRRHMWVEFVVGSLLAPRGFSPGTLVFPSPQKPTF